MARKTYECQPAFVMSRRKIWPNVENSNGDNPEAEYNAIDVLESGGNTLFTNLMKLLDYNELIKN